MKPSYILGNSANKIRLREAQDQGYYIPTNYPETYVPVLDYSHIDTLMKYASEYGLRTTIGRALCRARVFLFGS